MTDNPLLPVVKELAEMLAAQDYEYNRKTNALIARHAEQITRLKSGKLWARSSVDGPQSLEELRGLLERAGMLAVAWMIEEEIAAYGPPQDDKEESSFEEQAIEQITGIIEERIPVWQMLKKIQHVLHGPNPPTPKPPPMFNDNGTRWSPDDDIPF